MIQFTDAELNMVRTELVNFINQVRGYFLLTKEYPISFFEGILAKVDNPASWSDEEAEFVREQFADTLKTWLITWIEGDDVDEEEEDPRWETARVEDFPYSAFDPEWLTQEEVTTLQGIVRKTRR